MGEFLTLSVLGLYALVCLGALGGLVAISWGAGYGAGHARARHAARTNQQEESHDA